jgi:hypothetical protein
MGWQVGLVVRRGAVSGLRDELAVFDQTATYV